ncbi:universal stress protein [Streptomyces kaniharaensis]|uniref:Universal stress protein n=1 Tax=Streptomyces kaniharaensis TaxID=212423 RepID=A0A6N7L2X4_9ACTN|nr:universal stress protein [Streptomyces kaniharaensis]MQS17097.1 universal stress protein [Streptomyces kaniharaensis]
MNTYVLTGVDGSEESTAAARWAAAEAVRRGLGLRVVHARTWLDDVHADPGQPQEFRTLTARMLADAARNVRTAHPELDLRTDLLDGDDPVAVLLEAAEAADMLVIGSLGFGGFEGLLVGSVGLAAAARCEVPVVLVRAGEEERVTGPDAPEVVVGVDTRAPADQVLDFAFRQAASRRAVLRAVHGWTPPPVWGYAGWVAPDTEAEQFRAVEAGLLTQALAPWREKYPAVVVVEDCRVAGGAGAVVDASGDADLVVVGRRRRSRSLGMRLGPVAHAVIHHADAPVAVVPHD